MSNELQKADSRALHQPYSESLSTNEPRVAFEWLIGVLASQSPSLRSSNSFLVAYTGCPEAIDWLETNVAPPVSTHWGEGAALLGTAWPRIKTWLAITGSSQQLMALDTLLAYRAPAPNMSPLAQIASPSMPDAPTLDEFVTTLTEVLKEQSTLRIRNTVERVLAHATEILERKNRGVPLADLPLLYLQPDLFPNASEILSYHDQVMSGMRQSVQDLIKQFPPKS